MAEALKSFISGGVGGICCVIVGHPLDTIKVRLQTSNVYRGTLHCARATLRNEGLRGFARGVTAPLLSISPVYAMYFWGYDLGERMARSIEGKDSDEQLSLRGIAFAGAVSSIPGTIAMVPGDRIKVVLQAQGQGSIPVKYSGSADCLGKLIQEEGIAGLYRGTAFTILRDMPGSIVYFTVYESLKSMLIKDPSNANPGLLLVCGGVSGACTWTICVPGDVLKSRYQMSVGAPAKSLTKLVLDIVRNEGISTLYRGAFPAIARAIPATAATFLGMETSRKFLDMYF